MFLVVPPISSDLGDSPYAHIGGHKLCDNYPHQLESRVPYWSGSQ